MFVFGLGADKSLVYRSGTGSDWPGNWETTGGQFSGQPAALSWRSGGQINIFAVSEPSKNVMTKAYANKTWTPFENLGESIKGSIAVCDVEAGARADIWAVESTSQRVVHNYWVSTANNFLDPGVVSNWDFNLADKESSSAPAMSCRDTNTSHDVVIYGRDRTAQARMYQNQAGAWTNWTTIGGNFVGDPLLIEVGLNQFDFFGIGADTAMYHFRYTTTGGFTALEKVGGTFQSMATAVVTGTDRIDLMALGTDDKLKHRTLRGNAWASDWEDLGIFGNSAPLLAKMNSGLVSMFVLGQGGVLMQSSWAVSDDLSWKNLKWNNLGGNITLTGYSTV
jgi:hypothetical protein